MRITKEKLIEILEFNGFNCSDKMHYSLTFIKNGHKILMRQTDIVLHTFKLWFTTIGLDSPNLIKHLELELGKLEMPPKKGYYNIYELVEREHFHRCESWDNCCVLELDEKVYCLHDSDVKVYYTKQKKFIKKAMGTNKKDPTKNAYNDRYMWCVENIPNAKNYHNFFYTNQPIDFNVTVIDEDKIHHYICEYVEE